MSLEPTDAEIIEGAINSKLLQLHTAIPAQVVSYNALLQVADLKVVVNSPLEVADGSTVHEELPVIPNVKVAWPRAGGFTFHFPLAPGDYVLLVFCEASIADWREKGVAGDVSDLRRHDLSHGVAVPFACMAPDATPIPPTDAPSAAEAVLNGLGVFRVGAPSADFVAHATSTAAAIAALQAQITALGAFVTAAAAAFTKIAGAGAASPEPPGPPPGPIALAGAAGAAVTTAISSGSTAVTNAEPLIPATKLKAQ